MRRMGQVDIIPKSDSFPRQSSRHAAARIKPGEWGDGTAAASHLRCRRWQSAKHFVRLNHRAAEGSGLCWTGLPIQHRILVPEGRRRAKSDPGAGPWRNCAALPCFLDVLLIYR